MVYGLGPDRSRADEAPGNLVVDQVRPDKSGGLYSPNRAPLQPAAFMKLPVGSIAPQGWLLTQLQIQANGLNGRMPEVSDYLNYDKTGWITPANDGWEEVSYWLRGFAPLGYVLGDARIIETTRKWAQGIMATQQEDGWFGPARVKTVLEGGPDMWPHMPILAALTRYQEYTGDAAVIPFLTKYFQFQNAQDPKVFGRGWGAFRWGDNIDSIYWLYNQTGESFLLDLVRTIHAHSASYVTGIPTSHNVNLAQGFREPAQYSLVDSDPKYAAATYRVHDTIFSNYGQFPGGGFAGDETCRDGFTDPQAGH